MPAGLQVSNPNGTRYRWDWKSICSEHSEHSEHILIFNDFKRYGLIFTLIITVPGTVMINFNLLDLLFTI